MSKCYQCSGIETFADPLLEKVRYNLIDNALWYGGKKMTTIRVYCEEASPMIWLIVEDDGLEISFDDKRNLFTKEFGKNHRL